MENKVIVEAPLLEIRGVSKEFSGNYALREIDMKIFAGKVNAIVGENGAGKSTLMKIISGVYKGFTGEIIYNGRSVEFSGPREAEENGVVIIHQELNLIPHLSVAENLFLGREPLTKLGFIDTEKMNSETRKLFARLHLEINPSTKVIELRVGQQQMVEIARALMLDSKVLIMDEPTSAISDKEVEHLFQIIRELRNKGVAIVYISHKLDELSQIADRFVAIRDGQRIGAMNMSDATHDDIIKMMVGRDVKYDYVEKEECSGGELLKVQNLSFRNPLLPTKFLVDDISFRLCRGEIVGMSGLMGAGRTETLEALFGLYPDFVTGKIEIEGKQVVIKSVSDAIAAGIALVPEDRKLQGLVLNMNVTKNTSLASLKNASTFNFIRHRKERKLSNDFIEKLKIKVASADIEVQKLSGGNQQKVVIAKWLATNPKILLLDEPTRGIDVGAKIEIYKLINELAAKGLGIIVVSSELPEIMAICDRILVFSESKLTARYVRRDATEELIMKASISHKK